MSQYLATRPRLKGSLFNQNDTSFKPPHTDIFPPTNLKQNVNLRRWKVNKNMENPAVRLMQLGLFLTDISRSSCVKNTLKTAPSPTPGRKQTNYSAVWACFLHQIICGTFKSCNEGHEWLSNLVAPTHGGCHLDLEMRGAARASLLQQLTFRSTNRSRAAGLGAWPAVSTTLKGKPTLKPIGSISCFNNHIMYNIFKEMTLLSVSVCIFSFKSSFH